MLERHLIGRGIVCIVDTTNFHPELGAVVAEEKIKDDVENTRDVWAITSGRTSGWCGRSRADSWRAASTRS